MEKIGRAIFVAFGRAYFQFITLINANRNVYIQISVTQIMIHLVVGVRQLSY